jgi:hypothetical protein
MRKLACTTLALAALVSVASGCATVDLRPERLDASEASAARGRARLAAAVEAHGGAARFAATPQLEATLVDEWPGWLMRTFASPWPDATQRLVLQLALPGDDGRLEIRGADGATETWGLQHWVSWSLDPTGAPRFDPVGDADFDRKFWIPTIGYFLLAPFRLGEGGIVLDAGAREIGGRRHEGVFVTWGGLEPQAELDQYVAWFDAETHRLAWLEYTVRDFGGFIRGTMRYDDWRSVDGLVLPHRMTVVDGLGETEIGLHEMRVDTIRVGALFPAAHLVPRPELAAPK